MPPTSWLVDVTPGMSAPIWPVDFMPAGIAFRMSRVMTLCCVTFCTSTNGVAPLTDLLKDKKSDLAARKNAAEALGSMGKDVPKSALTALTEALKDNDVRIAAVNALGELGPEAKSAADAISATLKDNKDRNYRRAATESLKKIQGK